MPANLPPEYFEAEKRFKHATDPIEKSEALEDLLSRIPKHKGTDKLRAEYRKKLSKLKSQATQQSKLARHFSHYHIEKEGDARMAVIGAENTGKSSFVKAYTGAEPEISSIPFSTWTPTPGMALIRDIHIQMIDTPAMNPGHMEPEYFELLKTSDVILLMLDIQAYPIQQYQNVMEELMENHIIPVSRKSLYPDKQGLNFIPVIVAVNKDDGDMYDEDFDVLNELLSDENVPMFPVSLKTGRNMEALLAVLVAELKVIRVYSKPPGSDADMTNPFILKRGCTLEDFASKVHKDFLENLKSARLWGKGVFDGQPVGRDHILNDGDIVELHI